MKAPEFILPVHLVYRGDMDDFGEKRVKLSGNSVTQKVL